jgi:hypothetical protein
MPHSNRLIIKTTESLTFHTKFLQPNQNNFSDTVSDATGVQIFLINRLIIDTVKKI